MKAIVVNESIAAETALQRAIANAQLLLEQTREASAELDEKIARYQQMQADGRALLAELDGMVVELRSVLKQPPRYEGTFGQPS